MNKHNQAPQPIEADQAELITSLNGSPFVISGNPGLIRDMYQDELKAYQTRPVAKAALSHVEVPVAAPAPKDEYIDTSTLAPRELLRRKISAWVFDRKHGTSMYDMLQAKIADDRNVAFATRLGLLSVDETYCQKHSKAVTKLRGML